MSGRKVIYGPNDKPVRIVGSAWDSSGTGRRSRGWFPGNSSVNALVSGEVDLIRTRSRNEIRRNPWAGKAQDSWVANAVGLGIRPIPNTEDDALRRVIVDAWEEFVEECDVDGTSDFYGLQTLVARSFREGGDAFLRFRPRRLSDGLAVPLQLQAMEAEMLDHTKNEALPGGGSIKAGVEFDAIGRRVAYWMHREHPGEHIRSQSLLGNTPTRVPAVQIVHAFHVVRPGQVRGIPALAAVLAMLKEIAEVDDAHLMRAHIQNLFAIYEEVPERDAVSAIDADGGVTSLETDHDDIPIEVAEPGEHVRLPPGHKISTPDPPTGGPDFDAFIKTKLRSVAAGAGVTYEQLTCDLTGVNFSSIRAGLIQFYREMEQVQSNVLVFQVCRPVYRRWLETAILAGRVSIPREERPRIRSLMRAKWMATPGREYVDPEKEVRAIVKAIRAGLMSRTQGARLLGTDAEELDRIIANDNSRADRLGLVYDSDARRTTFAGVGQPSDPLAVGGEEDKVDDGTKSAPGGNSEEKDDEEAA